MRGIAARNGAGFSHVEALGKRQAMGIQLYASVKQS
jgi:hypothetical protein